jgi:mono/diheme cytochrome c family protein
MKTILGTTLALALLAVLGSAAVIYSGIYDVAATAPHWPITQWAMETTRLRSVKVHAAGIADPAALDDEATIVMGTDHFAAHCAVCHGAPGVPKGDIAKGLYPQPPNLDGAAKLYRPAELFWVLKNGLKMTGMPAWNDHSDEELWATVAFLEKLPAMTEQEYAKLIVASMTQGQHRHGGAEQEPRTEGHEHSDQPVPPSTLVPDDQR